MISHDVRKELDGMPPGTHAVLVYDSEERKEDALFTHLKVGGRYDGLVYACSEESPSEAENAMRRFGLDVDEREKEGTLSVKNYDEVYIVDGRVDIPGIIKGFSDLAFEYSQRGYGMRASAEMSCFFDHKRVQELVTYEKDLHRKFSFPAMGLCGYNLVKMYNSRNLDVLWPILKAHALVIMTGPRGSFALKPEEVDPHDVEKTMGAPKGSILET
jgi:MEDS: MEthanogen/methylotroph, DcmR Sensory domain